jgi:hypothetical protein
MASDERQFKVIILDDKESHRETLYPTGLDSLIRDISECCERYGMENSDPDPDAPFHLRIERIPNSEMDDVRRKLSARMHCQECMDTAPVRSPPN